ncbi:MAG: RNA polymerase sigma factor [Paraglaciecola sp.]|uniref:RNA polymerase sigma factor n=1 Tax=Paraglaciecola sp. TaxID=1920173 RepID=UPI0032998429
MFRQQESRIKVYIRRFMSNSFDIDDICQETVTRALEAEKKQDIREPKSFLYGVTRNIIRKKLDKDSRSLIDFIEDYVPEEYSQDESYSLDELEVIDDRMNLFREALHQLPEQCQKVFVLKKVYGYSHKEISEQLGISISTIDKHIGNGLKRCYDFMLTRSHGKEFMCYSKKKFVSGGGK